ALVSTAESLQDRQAPATEHDDLARLRPGIERHLRVAPERRIRDCCAEVSLCDRQVDGGVHVVALTHEALVGTDVHLDVDVACTRPRAAGVTLAGQANALAVVNA